MLAKEDRRVKEPALPGRILLIAQDEPGVQPVREALGGEGFETIEVVTDARKALPAFRQLRPDVIILEAQLEHIDSLTLMKQLSARAAADEFLPFIVLSNIPERTLRRKTVEAGLTAFFRDASDPEDISLFARQVAGLRDRSAAFNREAERRAREARQVEAEVARHLAAVAECKDHPESGHTARVGHTSALIALVLGMSQDDVETIRLAAPLHDVGKIGIPDAILLKEEPLTLEELDIVKTHTTIGAGLLAGGATRLFQMAEEIALYHHENWDGTGYTPGLEGEAIPLAGRIVRVVDAFDAMTSTRPFAEKWRSESAIEFIRTQSGQVFDPTVVEAFLEVTAEAEESADELARGII